MTATTGGATARSVTWSWISAWPPHATCHAWTIGSPKGSGRYPDLGAVFEYLQEVQVKTGGISAEYGGALGGVISAVTKSGGNVFRGYLDAEDRYRRSFVGDWYVLREAGPFGKAALTPQRLAACRSRPP